nr:upf0587 protein [Quercus suber]
MKFTAEMTAVTDLEPVAGWEDESIAFNIKLKCEYCGGISPEFRRICKEDLVQNDAHLVERCSDCGKRTGVVTILRQIGVPLKNGIETVVMILDIEGMTPVPNQFDTEFNWTAKSQVTGASSAHFKIEPGQPRDVYDGEEGDETPMGTIDRISCCVESV